MLLSIILGILGAALAGAVIHWAIILFSKLINFLSEKLEKGPGSEVIAIETEPIIDEILKEKSQNINSVSLKNLREKLEKNLGSQSVITAKIDGNKVVHGTVESIASNKMDKETTELFRANNRMLKFTA